MYATYVNSLIALHSLSYLEPDLPHHHGDWIGVTSLGALENQTLSKSRFTLFFLRLLHSSLPLYRQFLHWKNTSVGYGKIKGIKVLWKMSLQVVMQPKLLQHSNGPLDGAAVADLEIFA